MSGEGAGDGGDRPDPWAFLKLEARTDDAVYLVSGNDSLDDPAWGITPVMTGTPDEIAAWLRAQTNSYELSVVRPGGETLWARDYLGLPSN